MSKDLRDSDWKDFLHREMEKPYFPPLKDFVINEYKTGTIFPPHKDIFNAFRYTDLSNVKVLILGQDPYHGYNQAHGLAFSVNKNVDIPPSLRNIYKELHDDIGMEIPDNGNLEGWARQGVMLLNTVLTVRAGNANSHQGHGWETFTDNVIREIDKQDRPIVIMLWGNPSKAKMKLLTNKNHLILTAAHPSPLSAYRGFFGCRHFSKANAFLREHGVEEIDWSKNN